MLKPLGMGAAIAGIAIVGYTVPTDAQTVSSVGSSTSRKAPAIVAQASESTSEIEQSIFQQINQYRISRGLSALTWNAEIAKQARLHSRDMASRSTPFGHGNFDRRAKALNSLLNYQSVAENVAYMTNRRNLATVAVKAWIESAKHRDNIEGNYNLTGIGVSHSATGEVYFTEIFVRK